MNATTTPPTPTSPLIPSSNALDDLVGLAGQVIISALIPQSQTNTQYHPATSSPLPTPTTTVDPTTNDLLRAAAEVIINEAAARSSAAASASASAEAARVAQDAFDSKFLIVFGILFIPMGLLMMLCFLGCGGDGVEDYSSEARAKGIERGDEQRGEENVEGGYGNYGRGAGVGGGDGEEEESKGLLMTCEHS